MKIHVITIGDEILIGQTINSNATFIGQLLQENSYSLLTSSVVGDNENGIISEIKRMDNAEKEKYKMEVLNINISDQNKKGSE